MNSARILIIDDEQAIRRFLRASLEAQGYQVAEADGGKMGLQRAIEFRPELIILDLGLPDLPGQEVLKRVREWSKAPIIILTVVDTDVEKATLLDAGADDYLTKPFSVVELQARVRAALRHALPREGSPLITAGDLEIDLAAHTVRLRGTTVKLTATEYDVLKVLAHNAGKIVTQKQLLESVWGPNAGEASHYARIYISQLRKKLEQQPSNPSIILTEPGIGYRLVLN